MPRLTECNPKIVYAALNRPLEASKQRLDKDGNRHYGKWNPITERQVSNHIAGDSTFAFCPLFYRYHTRYARFLCFDIDFNFPERRRILVEILRKYPDLQDQWVERTLWCTTGSDDGRGKIFLPLRKPIPATDAVRIVKGALEAARQNFLWGPDEGTPLATDVFPKGEKGGIVRVLGRDMKHAPPGHLDQPLDIHGNPTNLAAIAEVLSRADKMLFDSLTMSVCTDPDPPHDLSLSTTKTLSTTNSYVNLVVDKKETRRNQAIEKARVLRTTPYVGGGVSILPDLGYLSKSAIATHGTDESGWQEFLTACNELEARIPPDKKGTLRQIRDLKTRERVWKSDCARAWDRTTRPRLSVVSDWRPLEKATFKAPEGRRVRDEQWGWYDLLVDLVHENGWNPHAFYVGYRTLGERVGRTDVENVRRSVDSAEKCQLLFRLDRATGMRDLATMYTLVGRGDTLQEAYDKGVASAVYRERLAQLKARGREPSPQKVVNGYLWYPPKAVDTAEADLPKAA